LFEGWYGAFLSPEVSGINGSWSSDDRAGGSMDKEQRGVRGSG